MEPQPCHPFCPQACKLYHDQRRYLRVAVRALLALIFIILFTVAINTGLSYTVVEITKVWRRWSAGLPPCVLARPQLLFGSTTPLQEAAGRLKRRPSQWPREVVLAPPVLRRTSSLVTTAS